MPLLSIFRLGKTLIEPLHQVGNVRRPFTHKSAPTICLKTTKICPEFTEVVRVPVHEHRGNVVDSLHQFVHLLN